VIFQNLLIRLFSMLHAAALCDIEDSDFRCGMDKPRDFDLELIDAESFDAASLHTIAGCDAKVELIFQWIQQLVVKNMKTEVLTVPPPILSRSFQELATGMVHFHDAVKLAFVPFPFPYVQTCDCLLAMHWLMVPFVVCQWVTRPWWAGFFCFLQVFTLWVLNLIACELENPFGQDANDVDAIFMQRGFNNNLRLLMKIETWPVPHLSPDSGSQSTLFRKAVEQQENCSTFQAILHYLEHHKGSAPPALKKRFNSRVSRRKEDGKARESTVAPGSDPFTRRPSVRDLGKKTAPVVTLTVAGKEKMDSLRVETLTARLKSDGGAEDVQGVAREKLDVFPAPSAVGVAEVIQASDGGVKSPRFRISARIPDIDGPAREDFHGSAVANDADLLATWEINLDVRPDGIFPAQPEQAQSLHSSGDPVS